MDKQQQYYSMMRNMDFIRPYQPRQEEQAPQLTATQKAAQVLEEVTGSQTYQET
jgi:hypothetical protein